MLKAPSPLLGFNNNVRHRGRVFHIQTEDSGVRHPHIITHLFADGGRILKTAKTSYAEHVGLPTMAETVRQLMQDQHKGMITALREGQYDLLLEEVPPPSARGGMQGRSSLAGMPAVKPSVAIPGAPPPSTATPAAAMPPAPTPAVPTPAVAQPSPTVATPAVATPAIAPPVPAAAPAAPPLAAQQPFAPPPPSSQRPLGPSSQRVILPRPSVGAMPAVQPSSTVKVPSPPAPSVVIDPPAARALGAQPPTITSEPPEALTGPLSRRRPNPRPRLDIDPAAIHTRESIPPARNVTIGGEAADASIDLDLGFEALGRAAAAQPITLPELRPHVAPLAPPAPPALPVPPPLPAAARLPPSLPPLPAPPPVILPAPSVVARYSPPRPTAIFATSRPPPDGGGSIFGEDLISEKSLDEVILGYLAEDLEAPEKK